ncbi:hypothetical protein K4A83_17005 [Spirulina subsalsa FACHB-351]|uniref:Uncharacterized protein n=1 Tax=Spirulina subsalsa FACHB-351 TaxID=234711 RepID=A0ABT3LA17_9CYAN|nr:hypothetical protein [Spirulina subsalsa]MCW6037959.1 hypothetical protein [Spirulina subsalsa FACHB-351]
MSYTFDILGVSSVLTFFHYQEQNPHPLQGGKAYLGSLDCTLDGFLESAEQMPDKWAWEWDQMLSTIVNFWLKHEDSIRFWQEELHRAGQESLVIGRVANVNILRVELESLWEN